MMEDHLEGSDLGWLIEMGRWIGVNLRPNDIGRLEYILRLNPEDACAALIAGLATRYDGNPKGELPNLSMRRKPPETRRHVSKKNQGPALHARPNLPVA